MAVDNHRLRERVNALNSDLEKAKAAAIPVSPPAPTGPPSPTTERRPLRTVQSPADGRQGRPSLMTRQDSKLCVKTLIETIESANKQAKAGECGGGVRGREKGCLFVIYTFYDKFRRQCVHFGNSAGISAARNLGGRSGMVRRPICRNWLHMY